MKKLHRQLLLATALAAGLAVASLATGPARAEESATVPTNPGLNLDTGQLNPGTTEQAYSKSADIRKVPTPDEARAALSAPDDPDPSLGPEPPQSQNNAAGTGMTTGARSSADLKQNRSGPIGATGQTMPAKFSQSNDVLDRVPIMAWPLSLSDEDRQHIYQAVMADKTPAASDAKALAPAGELDVNQALNEMHPLPASVSNIAGVQALAYVKGKNKVYLVRAATRTVVDVIGS